MMYKRYMQKQLNVSEIAKEYDKIYATHGLTANKKYYRWIISLLEPIDGNFLDIACGEGILLRELKEKNQKVKTYAFDISYQACKKVYRNSNLSTVLVADGQKIPFKDRTFDYVTCLGSLEHFIDPDIGVKEIVRILKGTGVACIILPNSFSIDIILEVLFKGGDSSKFQIIERTDTKNNWIKFLGKNGLQVNRIYKSNLWSELFQEKTFKLKSVGKFIKRLLVKYFCPLNLSREFMFVCSKK